MFPFFLKELETKKKKKIIMENASQANGGQNFI